MPLAITQAVLGNTKKLLLSEETFSSLKKHISVVENTIFSEQMFDVVFSNYVDLEKEMLEATSNHMFYMTVDYSRYQEDKLLINRKMINLLTANRMYVDQISQYISNILEPNDQAILEFKAIFSKMYDDHLAYRFFEALRNYVQHRGFPVQSSSYPARWVEDKDIKRIEYNCSFFLEVSEIKLDGKFKKSVLRELESIGEQVDIKQMSRIYMDCLYQIHCKFRSFVKDCVDKSYKEILNIIEEYSGEEEDSRIGLFVIDLKSEGIYSKLFPLSYDNLIYLQSLRNRHTSLSRISKYSISTCIF